MQHIYENIGVRIPIFWVRTRINHSLDSPDGLNERLPKAKAQRGGARRFKRSDALAGYLKELGAEKFEVEVRD